MIRFTDQQTRAIEAAGHSVIVTAAAGSGKTAVLTERCAHLVCGLPPEQRCRVDELLVVTFTEAAAAEMKSRILDTIRRWARQHPNDAHIRTQASLIDTAQISTIHSFCLWMLRRWFSEASIDPMAAIMEADEAALLQAEVLESLFADLYGADDELGRGVVRLVDDYGLGEDGEVADKVLRIARFLESLPDPQGWLDRCRDAVSAGADHTVAQFEEHLRAEVPRQYDHVRRVADFIVERLPAGAFYGHKLHEYADQLQRWSKVTDSEELAGEIGSYKVVLRGAPRMGQNADPEQIKQRDAAKKLLDDVRQRLLERRLQRPARFNRREMHEGLTTIAPYVHALAGVAGRFAERYRQAKQSTGVLDFADLERGAYNLLRDPDDPAIASPVAQELRSRFAHVLVDEFQDINPLQEAILRLVSREHNPDLDSNLFCVGDVKQSIYRFRLAEPDLFRRRVEAATDMPNRDRKGAANNARLECISLQDNFRSQPHLIAGVNLLFERLMTAEMGGVDYDESARLSPGLPQPEGEPPASVELHVLERRVRPQGSDEDAEDEQRYVDPTDPAQWKSIEREAYLIGTRLLALRESGLLVDGRPMRWGDVAILLRATVRTAGPLADFLGRMGIPAQGDAGRRLFDATEIRDVLALLHVLDNMQQDIPLAAVLRSGVAGLRFDEDDLVAIRCIDRDVPFHKAVRRYARDGENADLRQRLAGLMTRLNRWRTMIRRRPLADVLWHIYLESGFLAYVGGLAGGRARHDSLLALHERARGFARFAKQGLARFLRFIESLEASGRDLAGGAPAAGDAQDVVQVMSIHRAKGLEFPVVVVADLGRRFNLGDARGKIIFDRHSGIGLRAVDPERMIHYPTVLHTTVARSIETAARDEEMRVLYVALTRAKQRLILVGSAGLNGVQRQRELWREFGRAPSAISIESAGTPLDWVIPALATAPTEQVAWDQRLPADAPRAPLFSVSLHTDDQMTGWKLETFDSTAENPAAVAVGRLEPLPPEEPRAADGAAANLLSRLDWPYPHLAASSVRAVLGASEAKLPVDPFVDEYRPEPQGSRWAPECGTGFQPVHGAQDANRCHTSPLRRGLITHRVLEHFDFSAPAGDELRRLVEAGIVTEQEAGDVDSAAIGWFAGTPLGQRVRDAGDAYRREFIFISAEPANLFDPSADLSADETVLVRGIADGVLPGGDGLEVIDFKTDAIDEAGVPERVERYTMQMNLYARAVARIWRRPVSRCWLVFLTPRCVVEVPQEQLGT